MQATTDLKVVANERLIYETEKWEDSWSSNYNIKEKPKEAKEEVKTKTTEKEIEAIEENWRDWSELFWRWG